VVEDAVSAPGSGAGEAVDAAAVPAEVAFEAADAAFAAGAPLDEALEASSLLEVAAGGAGLTLGWEHDGANAEVGEGGLDTRFAAAAIGGDGSGRPTGTGGDSFDGGGPL
jgi:hypothetical protein